MDEIKSTQHELFSKLLDPSPSTNPFGMNRSGERAYRRAERLVAAIFLITNHIPAEERLRVDVRTKAMALLPQMLDLRDEMRVAPSAKTLELQATVRHLISLTKILVFGGYVSTQNAEVLIGALDEFWTFINVSGRSTLSDNVRFSKEDFLDVRDGYKGQSKAIKDKIHVKDMSFITEGQPVIGLNSALSQRSSGIVSILKTGGELNIRDIAAHLPEYGEKTIQRELTGLIARGVIKKSGEKRWSRYSLV